MTKNKGDLISREALIKWIDDSVSQYGSTYSTDMLNMWGLFKDYLINNAPTVEPDKIQAIMSDYLVYRCEPQRPQGEWIYNSYGNGCGNWHCSECGIIIIMCKNSYNNFCPNCGADMRGGAE